MNEHLLAFGNAFVEQTAGNPFLALSEGYLKVRAIEVALSLGWILQEGAGSSPSGPVADYVSYVNGALTWTRGRRLITPDEGSADLGVLRPLMLSMEIKARPDHGTKSQAQFQEMLVDVRRAATKPRIATQQTAFLFVFEQFIYRSFSGDKTERRGRLAKDGQWFEEHFPKLGVLVSASPLRVTALFGDNTLSMVFWHQATGSGASRVIVLGMRVDSLD